MTDQDFVSALRSQLESLLERYAALIAAQVPGVNWQVNLPSSRIYEVVAILTFVRQSDRQTELVAVSVESTDLTQGTLAIDVSDSEGAPLDVGGEPTCDSVAFDPSNAGTAAQAVEDKLNLWRGQIVRGLQP